MARMSGVAGRSGADEFGMIGHAERVQTAVRQHRAGMTLRTSSFAGEQFHATLGRIVDRRIFAAEIRIEGGVHRTNGLQKLADRPVDLAAVRITAPAVFEQLGVFRHLLQPLLSKA